MTEQYLRKPNTKCCVCLQAIYRRPSEIEKSKGKVYCSARCYGLSCRKETPCIICGKLILASLHKKTCSRVCSNKNRTGIEYKIKDIVVSLKMIKVRLLQARESKCERCNYQKTEILQVHHKNRNREDNNLNNLELLCPNCHYEEHSTVSFKSSKNMI